MNYGQRFMTGIKTIPKKKAVSRQSLEAFVQKT